MFTRKLVASIEQRIMLEKVSLKAFRGVRECETPVELFKIHPTDRS